MIHLNLPDLQSNTCCSQPSHSCIPFVFRPPLDRFSISTLEAGLFPTRQAIGHEVRIPEVLQRKLMGKTSHIIHDQNVVDICRRCSRQRTRPLKLVHVKGLWVKDPWGLKNSLIAMESTSLLQVGQEFPGRNSTRRFVLIICTTSTHKRRNKRAHNTYKVDFPLLLLWDFGTAWVMFFSCSDWFKMIQIIQFVTCHPHLRKVVKYRQPLPTRSGRERDQWYLVPAHRKKHENTEMIPPNRRHTTTV